MHRSPPCRDTVPPTTTTTTTSITCWHRVSITGWHRMTITGWHRMTITLTQATIAMAGIVSEAVNTSRNGAD